MAPHTGSHFLCGSSACIRAVPYARDGTRFSRILTSYPKLLRDGTSVNRLTSVASRSTNYGIVEIPPFSVLWCHGPQRVMWDGTAQTAKMSCRPAILRDSTKKRLLLFSWVVGRAARPTDDVEPVGRAFGVRGHHSCTHESIHRAPSPATTLMEARCSGVNVWKNRPNTSLPYPSCAHIARCRSWSTTTVMHVWPLR